MHTCHWELPSTTYWGWTMRAIWQTFSSSPMLGFLTTTCEPGCSAVATVHLQIHVSGLVSPQANFHRKRNDLFIVGNKKVQMQKKAQKAWSILSKIQMLHFSLPHLRISFLLCLLAKFWSRIYNEIIQNKVFAVALLFILKQVSLPQLWLFRVECGPPHWNIIKQEAYFFAEISSCGGALKERHLSTAVHLLRQARLV